MMNDPDEEVAAPKKKQLSGEIVNKEEMLSQATNKSGSKLRKNNSKSH